MTDHVLVERLQKPDLESLREFVRFTGRCVEILNEAAGLEHTWASLIWANVLQSSLPVLVCYRQDRGEWASEQLFAAWRTSLCVWGHSAPPTHAPVERHERRLRDAMRLTADFDYLGTFNLAVGEVITERFGTAAARATLEKLRAILGMSFDDLGRMLGVSGETVRRWERGSSAVPPDRMAILVGIDHALDRLLNLFKPERLAQIVSRKADLFSGMTARELILAGRIHDVVNRYEFALAYQA